LKNHFSDINTIKTELQKKYHCEINTQIIRNIRNDISNALIFMCKCSSPENRSRPSKTGFNNIMGKSKKLMDSIKIALLLLKTEQYTPAG
jgi:hypothetical protein